MIPTGIREDIRSPMGIVQADRAAAATRGSRTAPPPGTRPRPPYYSP
jgi:hypothetical protein